MSLLEPGAWHGLLWQSLEQPLGPGTRFLIRGGRDPSGCFFLQGLSGGAGDRAARPQEEMGAAWNSSQGPYQFLFTLGRG